MSATGYDIDARKVSRAKYDALLRLAKFLNAPIPKNACPVRAMLGSARGCRAKEVGVKGYRFYEDFGTNANKRKKVSSGNVVAVCLCTKSCEQTGHRPGRPFVNGDGTLEAIVALEDRPDSSTASGGISRKFLASQCKRVTEAKARKIHPSLFAWLDSFEDEY